MRNIDETMKIHILFEKIRLTEIGQEDLVRLRGQIKCKLSPMFEISPEKLTIAMYDSSNPNESGTAVYVVWAERWTKDLREHYEALHTTLVHIFDKAFKKAGSAVEISRSSVKIAVNDQLIQQITNMQATQKNALEEEKTAPEEEFDYQKLAKHYKAEPPKYIFDRLVVSDDVRTNIEEALAVLIHREKLFNEWGLANIMSPAVLLNFYGASGTGKTMGAEAIASKLGKNIIRATYADIESKYHGEGPKMLKALFFAAQQQDAVLFIDEADSMLSARLSNVSEGSEQAINSMRSQLLISLENFDGIVIFATNLIENYDKAFLTRLLCVEFKRPSAKERRKIWNNHLYSVGGSKLNIPLAKDIDLEVVAEKYDFCGRDIRNAVKAACIHTVIDGRDVVENADLIYACDKTVRGLIDLEISMEKSKMKVRNLSPEEEETQLNKVVNFYKEKYNIGSNSDKGADVLPEKDVAEGGTEESISGIMDDN